MPSFHRYRHSLSAFTISRHCALLVMFGGEQGYNDTTVIGELGMSAKRMAKLYRYTHNSKINLIIILILSKISAYQ